MGLCCKSDSSTNRQFLCEGLSLMISDETDTLWTESRNIANESATVMPFVPKSIVSSGEWKNICKVNAPFWMITVRYVLLFYMTTVFFHNKKSEKRFLNKTLLSGFLLYYFEISLKKKRFYKKNCYKTMQTVSC